jgi:hypothetical protein
MIAIVRFDLMRLEMPVRDGMRVIAVRLMHMLGRVRRRQSHRRHQEQDGNCSPR